MATYIDQALELCSFLKEQMGDNEEYFVSQSRDEITDQLTKYVNARLKGRTLPELTAECDRLRAELTAMSTPEQMLLVEEKDKINADVESPTRKSDWDRVSDELLASYCANPAQRELALKLEDYYLLEDLAQNQDRYINDNAMNNAGLRCLFIKDPENIEDVGIAELIVLEALHQTDQKHHYSGRHFHWLPGFSYLIKQDRDPDNDNLGDSWQYNGRDKIDWDEVANYIKDVIAPELSDPNNWTRRPSTRGIVYENLKPLNENTLLSRILFNLSQAEREHSLNVKRVVQKNGCEAKIETSEDSADPNRKKVTRIMGEDAVRALLVEKLGVSGIDLPPKREVRRE